MPIAPTIDVARAVATVDTDVHLRPSGHEELLEYVAPAHRDRLSRFAEPEQLINARRPCHTPLFSGTRVEATGPNGEAPGSDRDLVRRQLLGEAGVDLAMITPLVAHPTDPVLNLALTTAMNAWQAETWLKRDGAQFFGGICVPLDDVAAAVREIETWAGHPGFKQVFIAHDSDRPLGHPQYDPIWEAAARHGLPVGMHFQDSGRLPLGITPIGHFAQYVEFHAVARPLDYAAHLVSWICNGTFARIPGFRIAFLEGGFLWHRALLTRLAVNWDERTRWSTGPMKHPIACVRDQVRFASQPMERAPRDRDLVALLELADAETVLMFSSDYPHYDFDDPRQALPKGIPDAMYRRIMSQNAIDFYGLPTEVPAEAAVA
ncbi:amidohydrolase family protein [Pseudonocardia sp. RS010]|uniref:amidohydrolase family protein n=1 Tax=Pseudonocardia sp. RS010 TaxID=3385979 RepID=UPI0039A01658